MRTPLYEKHVELGAKIVDFHGWEMPLHYGSIIEEHLACRQQVVLFDVSHMGEVIVKGPDFEKFVNYIITNNFAKIVPGQIVYSPMCYEHGGVVDDLLAYKFEDKALLVVNAANIKKDYEWILEHSKGFDVEVLNVSDDYLQIAVQGPSAEKLMKRCVNVDVDKLLYYNFVETVMFGEPVILSRTGYTGEDGFEVYASSDAVHLWSRLLEVGKEFGIRPAGLGARDTLRFEAGMPLYGHELSEDITPLEAGLRWTVKFKKGDFIGREALLNQKKEGLKRRLRGFEVEGRRIARGGEKFYSKEGDEIGFVTSGIYSPILKKSLAMGIVNIEYKEGKVVEVDFKGKRVDALVVSLPFVEHKTKRAKT